MARFAGFVLAFLIIASMIPYVVAEQGSDSRASVEGLFNDIIGRLNATLALLESINPSEAVKYREAIGNAIAKIEEARRKAGQSPETALAEAYRAQVEALNRTRSVLAKANITYPPGLVVALDVKASMVKELNNTIQYLKSANITVELWVEVKLASTMHNIKLLREGLVSGALNASQVAVKLEEVNRNISDVRVYLAKTVKHKWVKVSVEGFVAGKIAGVLKRTASLSTQAMRGDPDALDRIAGDIMELENLLAKLAAIGIPEDIVKKLQNVTRCSITPGAKLEIEVKVIAKMLVNAGGDEVKAKIIIAELMRCLKQPLEVLHVPGKAKMEIEKGKAKAREVEEEAGGEALKALEKAPQALIGLLEAEMKQLEKLYRLYKDGKVAKEEVEAQALLVLEMVEQARQVIEKLPKPLEQGLQKIMDEAVRMANNILEDITKS